MDYQYIEPEIPSFARWRDLHRKFPDNSLLRMMEYEALGTISITGDVLDIGGGENARYKGHLPGGIDYHSVNIDPAIAPTWLIEPGADFPIEDGRFDFAVCFNTLEHVYDPRHSLAEALRVLKPGGKLVVTVPWMFRIHAHPDDYNRNTPSWWKQTFDDLGFSGMSLKPLVWGRNSTALTISGTGFLPKRAAHSWAHIKDTVYAKLRFRSGRYEGRRGDSICGVSVGWFIVATK